VKKDVLFLKKKNQKNFCPASRVRATVGWNKKLMKFFLLLFCSQKSRRFLPVLFRFL